MPTYAYICESGHEHEETRGINEEPLNKTCVNPGCSAKLVRKFTAPAITFNGTGFNAQRG
jgi:putative FmdB family regulatory protein